MVLPPQHCGATRNAVTSAARSSNLTALGEHLTKVEEQLLNILVLRRTGLQPQDLGWLEAWKPAELLNLLCDYALKGQLVLPPQHCGATRNAVTSAARSSNLTALGEHLTKVEEQLLNILVLRRTGLQPQDLGWLEA